MVIAPLPRRHFRKQQQAGIAKKGAAYEESLWTDWSVLTLSSSLSYETLTMPRIPIIAIILVLLTLSHFRKGKTLKYELQLS